MLSTLETVSQDELAAFDKEMSAAESELASLQQEGTQESSTEEQQPVAAQEQQPAAESVTPTAQKTDKPEEAKAEVPPKTLSEYEKAKERQNKTWQKINEEKAQLAKEREELARIKAEVEQAKKSQPAEKPQKTYTAEEYSQAADRLELHALRLEKEGNFEEAQKKLVFAEALRKQAEEVAKQPVQSPAAKTLSPELKAKQDAHWEAAKKDFPELLKPGSPMNAATQQFITENPTILEYEKGPYLAAQFVAAQLGAARVPDLEKQLSDWENKFNQLQTKYKELEQLTSVPSAGVTATTPSGPKSWNEMSVEEMESRLSQEFYDTNN